MGFQGPASGPQGFQGTSGPDDSGTIQPTNTNTFNIRARNEGTPTGNARGEYSVDLQTQRTAADQVAAGSYSVICGGQNNKIASSFANHGMILGGRDNYINGYFGSIVGGYNNLAYGYYSTVLNGGYNEANGTNSTVGGYNCTTSTSSTSAFCHGNNSNITGSSACFLIGDNCEGGGGFSHTSGFACRADGSYAFIHGRGTTPVGTTTSFADGAHSFSMGNACGVDGDYAWGAGLTITASGNHSFCKGQSCTATANRTFVHGITINCTAAGAVGIGNTIDNAGRYSLASGLRHNIGSAGHYTTMIGASGDTNIDTAFVHGGGRIATGDANDGAAQAVQYILHGITTNATQTEILTEEDARLVLPDDSTWTFEMLITARRSDANDESAAYRIFGCIDRNTGVATTALVGSLTTDTIEDTVAWNVTVDADTTNGSLRIQVTGEASKTIRWVATVRTTQTFG
jgi:hypothetical protein